jgi:hypothetical protein
MSIPVATRASWVLHFLEIYEVLCLPHSSPQGRCTETYNSPTDYGANTQNVNPHLRSLILYATNVLSRLGLPSPPLTQGIGVSPPICHQHLRHIVGSAVGYMIQWLGSDCVSYGPTEPCQQELQYSNDCIGILIRRGMNSGTPYGPAIRGIGRNLRRQQSPDS